ncbi:MAG: hypothetical protein QOH96_3789, partial [Blastocatellia bacterium]|nr:hypothetical protein [Blastocatellia bacterium]
MNGCKLFKFKIACVSLLAITTTAQTRRADVRQDLEKVVVAAGEVSCDVVVRDKKGRPVKDLQASDFDVYEDGVKQELNSFRLVASKSVGGNSIADSRGEKNNSQAIDADISIPGRARPGGESGPGITAVALVFDRLEPDARARAREAALSYLGENSGKNELVGVFLTDLSLVVLQPFTDDKQLVKLGIEKAGLHASSLYDSNNQRAREMRDRMSGVPTPQG